MDVVHVRELRMMSFWRAGDMNLTVGFPREGRKLGKEEDCA